MHGVKSAARPVINATTAGFGAPVASTAEDMTSVVMSFVAIILPVLVLVFLLAMIVGFGLLMRRRRRRKEAKWQARYEAKLARERTLQLRPTRE